MFCVKGDKLLLFGFILIVFSGIFDKLLLNIFKFGESACLCIFFHNNTVYMKNTIII